MSDERDRAGSAGTGSDAENDGVDDTHGQTAVVTRPLRPTGKRTRRAAVDTDAESDAVELTESSGTENGSGKTKKKTKKEPGKYPNPFLYVVNYIKQVIAELRKVIWPNRKQMVSYTSVVLVFLVFMVALIAGADYGLARLVGLVFGE
ncbi:preprotein translocase subunit SecE [Mycobacterium sp. GA-2829]|uniref:preprotein translocase subunit SecE n=1 Tax=Mycobacterium sp. GA-2829 TaxID=1772283 RepID=UPI0007402647|nr:preprotein translocase subunit SecE [Mycobacterium sp. GA-2829]KUI39184.1 preprotein translocase subunit SecE [Mycobacterium sp. GA-2829]